MDHTAPAVLDLGLLLFLAAVAGKSARQLGLPAVVGYLLVGVLVSPFTPGGYRQASDERSQLVVWGIVKVGHVGGRAVQLAVGLGQVGEFSYVLGALALGAGLITKEVSAGLIGAVVISIAASSILVRLAPRAKTVAE